MADKEIEKPHYCKKCNKCRTAKQALKNLKVIRNTGWTHDIFCLKLQATVYGM